MTARRITPTTSTATKTVAKKVVATKAPATKAAVTKAAVAPKVVATKAAVAPKVVTKKVVAKAVVAKKAVAKKAVAKKAVAKKVVTKKVVAKQVVTKKVVAAKVVTKKAASGVAATRVVRAAKASAAPNEIFAPALETVGLVTDLELADALLASGDIDDISDDELLDLEEDVLASLDDAAEVLLDEGAGNDDEVVGELDDEVVDELDAEDATPAVRSRDDWNDLNRELFIQRAGLQEEISALEKVLPTDRTPRIERQLRTARRRLDDVTFQILDSNYGLLRRYVRKFTQSASAEDIRDFESAATVGLMRAIDSYDPDKGRFAQWAFKPIQREVLRAVHGADHQNMNAGDFERRPDILRATRKLQGEHDENPRPSFAAVAAESGATVEQVKRVLNAPRLSSLAAPIGDGQSTVADVVPDTSESVEDMVIDAMAVKDLESYGLSRLDPRELFVIVRRMGLDREPKQRLSAIGEVLGLSREAVRQIESKSRGKLSHPVVLRKMVRQGRD